MSQLDRELNAAIESGIQGIAKGIKRVGLGFKKMNTAKNIAGLICMLLFAVAAWFLRGVLFSAMSGLEMPRILQILLFTALLMSPFIYLGILGSQVDRRAQEFEELFAEIGFYGKDGKYPTFLRQYEDAEKRMVYVFKSSISVGEWRKNQERIETALDCTILQIKNSGSRKIIEVIAISSECGLPTMIRWDDGKLIEKESCLAVGEGMMGQVWFDLNKTPHVLVAGETGSGKSIILHTLLWQMVLKAARIIMLDFKGGVEFGIDYEEYGEVITDRERAVEVLENLVKENDLRLRLFRAHRAKNIAEYNEKTGSNLCRIGVISDEIAEMMDTTGVPKQEKEVYERLRAALSTLARLSRATGINLIMGVQRPDANVLPGQIKNNIPVRICGRFADKSASEIVLNTPAATGLSADAGRFLFLRGNELIEFQAYYFEDAMMRELDLTPGTMLIEQGDSGGGARQPTEQGTKEKARPPRAHSETDYGLDRYDDPEKLDFDFDFDNEISWGVDEK